MTIKNLPEYITTNLCPFCPLQAEGCYGMACYGGEPIEPACSSLDDSDDIEDTFLDCEAIYARIKEEEEQL